MLAIVIKVCGCNKGVGKDTIVDLSFPKKIGLHADQRELRQMCTEASVLWPVKLEVRKTRKILEQGVLNTLKLK